MRVGAGPVDFCSRRWEASEGGKSQAGQLWHYPWLALRPPGLVLTLTMFRCDFTLGKEEFLNILESAVSFWGCWYCQHDFLCALPPVICSTGNWGWGVNKSLLHGKANTQQSEETICRMGEDLWKLFKRQGVNFQNISGTQKAQEESKNKTNKNSKQGANSLNRNSSKKIYRWPTSMKIAQYH